MKQIPNIITALRIIGAIGIATFAAIQEGHLIRTGKAKPSPNDVFIK